MSIRKNPTRRNITVGRREFALPRSKPVRIIIGILLVIFGLFGFLPILGFWMVPLGLLILSAESAILRRWRRRLVVSIGRKIKSKPKR